MRIEVHEADRSVHGSGRAQLGEGDAVVAADPERDYPGAVDRLDVLLDARERVLDVPRNGGRVAVVDAREPSPDHHVLHRVVGAQHRRGRAHRLGAEARPWAIGGAGVPRHAEDRDLDAVGLDEVR